jgi:hypothetical protein
MYVFWIESYDRDVIVVVLLMVDVVHIYRRVVVVVLSVYVVGVMLANHRLTSLHMYGLTLTKCKRLVTFWAHFGVERPITYCNMTV